MSQIRLTYDGNTGYPTFTAGQLNKIREIKQWMAMSARVCPGDEMFVAAVRSLDAVLARFPEKKKEPTRATKQ